LIEDVPSRYQGAKLLVGAALAEHVSDVIKIVRQEFAGKIQYQRLAEVKVPLAGNQGNESRLTAGEAEDL
jgi:hypothetical protein